MSYEEEFLNAARQRNLEKMKELIKKIDINFCAPRAGDTALIIATRKEHFKMIKFLISNGAKIDQTNSNGWTALHVASYWGSLKVAKYIVVQKGAKLDCKTPNGLTPLDIAENKYGPNHKIVEFLKKKDEGTKRRRRR